MEKKMVKKICGNIGAIWYVLTPSFRNPAPIITTKKQIVQPEDAFEDTAFKPGFEIVKF
jgi:hypothetical protein